MIVIYNADCGICTRSARWLSSHLAANFVANSTWTGPVPSPEQVRQAVYVVGDDGSSYAGVAAIGIALANSQRARWRMVGAVLGLPGVCVFLSPAYKAIARHRRLVSRMLGLPVCAVPNSRRG